MAKSLENQNLTKLTQEQITKLNNLLYTKEIKFEDKPPPQQNKVKKVSHRKTQAQVGFTRKSYQILKKNISPHTQRKLKRTLPNPFYAANSYSDSKMRTDITTLGTKSL